jgi:gas vesicle protein
MLMGDENRSGEFLAGAILGGMIGAAIALIMAPQRGDETRAQLREKGIEVKERMIELTEEARKTAEQWQEDGRSAIETQMSRVEEAVEEGKKAAAKKKKELLQEIEQESGETEA